MQCGATRPSRPGVAPPINCALQTCASGPPNVTRSRYGSPWRAVSDSTTDAGSSRYRQAYRSGGDPDAFLGNDPVLLRPYDQYRDAGTLDGDDRIVHAVCIERWIDGDAEELEGLAYRRADLWRVFADAASEHERVDPVHARRHGRDRTADTMDVDIEGEPRALVSGVTLRYHRAHVAIGAGQAREVGVIEQPVE